MTNSVQGMMSSVSKTQLLSNLYIHTTKKFPHVDMLSSKSSFIYDFYEYSGVFYYYFDNQRTDICKDCLSHFDMTLDEMIDAVNKNTGDDFIVIPTERAGIFKLYDKNGDSVERILLNNTKLSNYLRTLDDGYGLYLYPAKSNVWYITIAPMPEDSDLRIEDFEYVKKVSSTDFQFFFFINSYGNIEEFTDVKFI